jgi:hypothetical protein
MSRRHARKQLTFREWGVGSGEWEVEITSLFPIPHSPLPTPDIL